MHVLHINNTSHMGGAARAMQRLHAALVDQGHQSQFLVGRTIEKDNPLVHVIWDQVSSHRSLGKSIQSRIGNRLEKYLGINSWANRTTLNIAETGLYQWADIIDLRNLFGGFFNLWSLPSLSRQKPVVWRLPDLWAVTGHCAYPYDCQRWVSGCYRCPLMTPAGREIVEPKPTVFDSTRRVWQAKRNIYSRSKLHIIVTTRWMKEQVSRSILQDALSINVISNGVNLDVYKPYDRKEVRQQLGLDPDDRILLWAAGGKGNYRKGYHLAYQALEELQETEGKPPLLITMGGEEGWSRPETLTRVRHFGFVYDAESQAKIFSAADAFLCTTLADGQPQTALESLACGTPIISFDIGPMPDLAIPSYTGLLARTTDSSTLAETIRMFYNTPESHPRLQENCLREAREKYDIRKQTGKYITLYENLLV
jgi:glycosyltransferase involved in cell wall biosynthesis